MSNSNYRNGALNLGYVGNSNTVKFRTNGGIFFVLGATSDSTALFNMYLTDGNFGKSLFNLDTTSITIKKIGNNTFSLTNNVAWAVVYIIIGNGICIV